MNVRKFAPLFAGALVLAVGFSDAVSLAQEATTPRQDAMKAMGAAMKAIKGVVDVGGPAADVAAPAAKIVEISAKIPDLFPQGSDAPDDGAKPEIWTNWTDFTGKARALNIEANALAGLVAGGDMASIGAQFKKTGGSCGTCHETYRAKKE